MSMGFGGCANPMYPPFYQFLFVGPSLYLRLWCHTQSVHICPSMFMQHATCRNASYLRIRCRAHPHPGGAHQLWLVMKYCQDAWWVATLTNQVHETDRSEGRYPGIPTTVINRWTWMAYTITTIVQLRDFIYQNSSTSALTVVESHRLPKPSPNTSSAQFGGPTSPGASSQHRAPNEQDGLNQCPPEGDPPSVPKTNLVAVSYLLMIMYTYI